jgi:hypothetical protein
MLQAEEQRKQAAAMQAKVIANKANERHRQAKAAIGEQRQQVATAQEKALAQAAEEQRCQEATTASAELVLIKECRPHEALMRAALYATSSLINEQRCHKAAKRAAALAELALANEQRRHKAAKGAAASAELAPAKEQCCHEAVTQTAMSAESSLTNERCRHKAAARAVELAELVLAKKQRCHKTTAQEKALANNACKQRCQKLAKCTAVLAKLALAAEQTGVLADSALPELALAEDKWCQEETAKKQRRSDDEGVMAPVLPPDPLLRQSGSFG